MFNYVPYLSTETKSHMKERDNLKKEATLKNDTNLFNQYKEKRNFIKQCIEKDKKVRIWNKRY